MLNNNAKFLLYEASDGVILPGAIYSGTTPSKKVAIFIHGSGANFFKMRYFPFIYKELSNNGIDFISVDNRGREQAATIHKKINGETKSAKSGTIYEDFNESLFDIEGIVKYTKESGYKDIYLIGESLGTVKIMNYCINTKDINKVILMSPVDMVNRFRTRVKDKYDELIEASNKLVRDGNLFEMVTDEFSAIKVSTTMAKNTNSDIFKLEEDRESEVLNYNGYVAVIVGTEDHCSKDWGMNYLEEKLSECFENAKFSFNTIEGANHLFKKHEEELAKQIVKSILWMN